MAIYECVAHPAFLPESACARSLLRRGRRACQAYAVGTWTRAARSWGRLGFGMGVHFSFRGVSLKHQVGNSSPRCLVFCGAGSLSEKPLQKASPCLWIRRVCGSRPSMTLCISSLHVRPSTPLPGSVGRSPLESHCRQQHKRASDAPLREHLQRAMKLHPAAGTCSRQRADILLASQ